MEKLVKRLNKVLTDIEDIGSITITPEIIKELKAIIQDISDSKCSNDMFCGMDKKW
jgi:hypothetical protein